MKIDLFLNGLHLAALRVLVFLTGLHENDMIIDKRTVIDMGNIIVRSGNLYHSPTWA